MIEELQDVCMIQNGAMNLQKIKVQEYNVPAYLV
jgi:hypothetical protein